MESWRVHSTAAGVFLVFVVALFPATFFGNLAYIGDSDRLMHELVTQESLASTLRRGEEPGWNPAIFCGIRLAGDPILPSSNLVARGLCILFPDHLAVATTWRYIAEMLLCLFTAYALFQRHVPHPWAAIPPALILGASLAALEVFTRGENYATFAYLPTVVWILRDAPRRGFLWNVFLLVPPLHMQVTSSLLQYLVYAVWFYTFYIAVQSATAGSGRLVSFLRQVGILATALLLTAGAGAGQFLPLADALRQSNRVAWTPIEAWINISHSPMAALRVLFPFLFGNWATFPVGRVGPNTNDYEMCAAYPGIVLLIWTATALTTLGNRGARLWACGALFTLLASLATPLLFIPYFGCLGTPLYHGRLNHFLPVVLAFLAPWGLKAFVDAGPRLQTRWSATLLAIGAVSWLASLASILEAWTACLPDMLLACFGQVRDAHDAYYSRQPIGSFMPPFHDLARDALRAFSAGAIALAVPGLLLGFKRIGIPLFFALVAVVGFFDSLWVARHTLPPFFHAERDVRAPNRLSAFLEALPDKGLHRVSFDAFIPWPGASITCDLFRHNLHDYYGLLSDGGYANYMDQRVNRILSFETPFLRWKRDAVRDPYWMDLCAVKYVVAHEGPAAEAVYRPSCDPVFRTDGAVVYRKREALARFRIVDRFDASRAAEQILDGLRGKELPLDVAHLEAPPPAGCRAVPQIAAPSLDITINTPNLIQGKTVLSEPAILLSTNTFDPGWRAEVNGGHVPVLRANYAFQAVFLPAGESDFRLSYHPPHAAAAAATSAGAAGAWLLAGLAGRRRRRQAP